MSGSTPPRFPPVTWIPATGMAAAPAYPPVLARDFPDPGILAVDGVYYAFATNSNEQRCNVQVARSGDLLHWEILGDAMPELPAWAVQQYGWVWAPAPVFSPCGQGYLLYFTARLPYGARGLQAIGVAASPNVAGPFCALDRTLVCPRDLGGAIDPSVFVDVDGQAYLLWKNDGNSCGLSTGIFAQKLSVDGFGLVDQPRRLLVSDRESEGGVIEAPTLIRAQGRYVLFYSCNAYKSSRYAICAAQAERLFGPYAKLDVPVLASQAERGIIGPGGQEIVTAPDGSLRLVFHAWPGKIERSRFLYQARLLWEEGLPVVEGFNPAAERAVK